MAATGVSRAFGPEIPKKSEKSLPVPPARGPKKSGKSPEQTFSRLFPDFSDFFEAFSRHFGTPGAGGPGRLFADFFGISGPEGPRNSCSSPEGSQSKVCTEVPALVRACRATKTVKDDIDDWSMPIHLLPSCSV